MEQLIDNNLCVEMRFNICGKCDIDKAKKIIINVFRSDKNVLKKPTPKIEIKNFNKNIIELIVFPYAKIDNFRYVYWNTRQKIVESLNDADVKLHLLKE